MIVFDASTLVGAALKPGSVPDRAVLKAVETEVFALSAAVAVEVSEVLSRPKFAHLAQARRERILSAIQDEAAWFVPAD